MNKFLNKKKKRNENHKETKYNHINILENIFTKSKKLYDDKSSIYDLDNTHNIKDKKWTSTILKTGTFEDKISALSLYIKSNPQMCLKYIDQLIKLAKRKNRRQTEASVIALKDLFLENILTNKKLLPFHQSVENKKPEELTDESLIQYYIDDFIHREYLELINVIEDILINDPLKQIKKKFMNIILEMLIRRPEREERLLEILVNKLGDPDVEIANHTIKLLKDLQQTHSNMSLVILKNVQNFLSKSNNISTKFYSLIYLTQMILIGNKEYLEYSLKFFFDLFTIYTENNNEESLVSNLSLVVKRINDLCKFCSERKINVKQLIDEKLETLYRLSHSKCLKLRVETLNLIFSIIKHKNNNNTFLDRYYRSLYELLLIKEIPSSKHIKNLLRLIQQSLLFDTNNSRVAAFLKRLLQLCLISEPPFITCSLLILSQIMRNKNKIWKMFDNSNENKFDFNKRDPLYTNADEFPISELTLLTNHYHPTIQKFSNFIMENYKKETIQYEGDPLLDFSVINFLDKFIFKNPKLKSNKKKKDNKLTEDEELKKFLGEDQDNINNEENGENLDFINKFNKINKTKLSKKKLKFREDDIEDFADKVMDQEYAKLDKDIDDDYDLDYDEDL